jgi:hypothetical protein
MCFKSVGRFYCILYLSHYNLLLIKNASRILNKDRIFGKNILENKEMDFRNGVMNIHYTSHGL